MGRRYKHIITEQLYFLFFRISAINTTLSYLICFATAYFIVIQQIST